MSDRQPDILPPIRTACPTPHDFRRRALIATLKISGLKEELSTMALEAAEHSHAIDGPDLVDTISAALSDLSSDFAGAMQRAATHLQDEMESER